MAFLLRSSKSATGIPTETTALVLYFRAITLFRNQSVVSNVELALTLSGVTKAERHERALEALDKVGLKAHATSDQISFLVDRCSAWLLLVLW